MIVDDTATIVVISVFTFAVDDPVINSITLPPNNRNPETPAPPSVDPVDPHVVPLAPTPPSVQVPPVTSAPSSAPSKSLLISVLWATYICVRRLPFCAFLLEAETNFQKVLNKVGY